MMHAPPATTQQPLSDNARELLRECGSTLSLSPVLWAVRGEERLRVYPPVSGDLPGEPPPDAVPVPYAGEWQFLLEVRTADGELDRAHAELFASFLGDRLRGDREIMQMSAELVERYEEITLLYSISEILGSVISLEEAAAIILSEVIGTLGARRAALWVEDERVERLRLLASVGLPGQENPIALDDPGSVTAEVFRTRQALIMDPADVYPRGEHDTGATRRGYFLSVPVSYTPPQGEARTVGVINLVGRTSNEPYTAGDLQLVAAIASQIGAAVENGRLVEASLRQERLMREMELAHDLQLKLLPSAAQFADYAEVGARCIPADSVGGDFYHLFRLQGGRMGVLVGDVSSHGFSAALIMALTMSAVAINASEGDPPADVLRRTHRALIDELESTEMFVTLVYIVIDPVAGTLTYASAGHHHAFRVTEAGEAYRLDVTNPPLGMVDLDHYAEDTVPWAAGKDLLFLFTDGLSDSLGRGEVEGEQLLLDTVRNRTGEPVDAILDDLFAAPDLPTDVPADDRTAVLVRIG
jgi:phosphoserine phosphatase RsbU/P